MSAQISLKAAERKVFHASFNDGSWDIFLGCVFLMFPIAIYLSHFLGDFWSSMVFVPFWALVYLAIRLVRARVVAPRIGFVKFGPARKAKMARMTTLLLVFNLLAFSLGLAAALLFASLPGIMYGFILGLALLAGFSLAGYLLDFNRLYAYGLLLFFAPLVGEWAWAHGYLAHHGFPVTFGLVSAIMIVTGLVVFTRLLRDNPLPPESASFGEELHG